MTRRLRILVSGMIAKVPRQGGATWAVLQYVLGLQRLGHDVTFVECVDSGDIQPAGMTLLASANAAYFRLVIRDYGLANCAALIDRSSQAAVGLSYAEVQRIAAECDVVVNLSGTLTDPSLLGPAPIRVYVDLDPVFNQMWHELYGIDMRFGGHSHYVTVAHGIGEPDSPVPTCGLSWIPTWQPIVLDHWPVADRVPDQVMTTVANWRGYGSIEHGGVLFGQKAHALRALIDLPRLSGRRFVLALAIHPDETRDLTALREHGWELVDPARVANSPETYRQFIHDSRAEFGVAKTGYVLGRCGWFSDRSVCYLASGRPVLAQDTGFSRYLPTGQGLLPFSTTEDATAQLDVLDRDYPAHARAARRLAEEYFDSNKVLARMLRAIGAAV